MNVSLRPHTLLMTIFSAVLFLTLTGCANQPTAETYDPPGFLMGLWHGLVAPIALVGHIFDQSIRIYAFPNGGGWYDFGFLLGIGGGGVGWLGALAD
jgi:hypothetical protein